jgi:transcriptional regulator with XRE-family HTH domain
MYQVSLKAARVNAGLRQEEAATAANVSKSTIISWEQGKTYPRSDQLKALCSLYKVPMDVISLQ